MTVVAALGDSFTTGVGVMVRVDPAATWASLLTKALPDGQLLRLAQPGARIRDVRDRQIPQLPDHVDLATLIVGLKDVASLHFDAVQIHAALIDLVAELQARAAQMLLGRLHDPVGRLPMPPRMARAVRARVTSINTAVDVAARHRNVHLLDLARVRQLAEPAGWAFDRVHPSAAGHRGLAIAASAALGTVRHRPPAEIRVSNACHRTAGPAGS